MLRSLRKVALLLGMMLFPSIAAAQTSTVTGTIVDANNNAYFPGTVAAAVQSTTGQTIPRGVILSSGPFPTTIGGNFSVTVTTGQSYTFTFCSTPTLLTIPTTNVTPQQICFTTPVTVISGNTVLSPAQIGTVAILGPNTSSLLVFNGVPTGACGPQQTAVNSLTGQYYVCLAGAWSLVGPGAGTLATPVTAPNPFQFNTDMIIKGPNPYVDIRSFGARIVSPTSTPAIPGITATISSGSSTAVLSSASSFVNGDGVTIFGAGAANTMTTPNSPIVTPSVSSGPTGTGVVVGGPTSATTYNYQVMARASNGSLTPAGPVGSTTIGQASLGSQSISISTISRAPAPLFQGDYGIGTATTSAPHTLAAGSMIYIQSVTDTSFDGWWIVATVPDTTHFTFNMNLTTTASSTSGTVFWFNCNHITWTAVTGAFQYYIYGRTGGSLSLLGVSLPGKTYWDDFGSVMMQNFIAPFFIPTTPPVAASAASLTTTIVSGAGTNSLTLANSATTSVVSNTILFDNAPAIAATINAIRFTTGGSMFIPLGAFVTNSYLNATGIYGLTQLGSLYLNDTMEINGVRWTGLIFPQAYSGISFSFEGLSTITVNRAIPGVYAASQNSSPIRGIAFSASSNLQNNAQLVAYGGMNQGTFEDCSFATAVSGNVDYMGVGFVTLATSDVFFNKFKNITVGSGPGQVGGGFSGSTATPVIEFLPSGTGMFEFDGISIQDRGIFVANGNGIFSSHIKFGRMQGIITPLLMLGSTGGATGYGGTGILIDEMQLDTSIHPMVANLGPSPIGSSTGTVFKNVTGSPGISLVTGNPAGVVGDSGVFGIIPNTQQTNMDGFGIASSGTGNIISAAAGATIGVPLSTPTAPTTSISGAGTRAAGTYAYAILPMDANGLIIGGNGGGSMGYGNGPLGAASTPLTINGSQGVLINWTLVPGQVASTICVASAPPYTVFGCPDSGGGHAVSGTSFTDIGTNLGTNSSAQHFTGLASGATPNGLETWSLMMTGGGFKDTVSGTFTANRTSTLPDTSGVVPVTSYQNSTYDNFNRANGSLGSNWTTVGGSQAISSNTAADTAGDLVESIAIWNANSFGPTQFSQAVVTGVNNIRFMGVAVLMSTSGNGYVCHANNSGTSRLDKFTGGSASLTLASGGSSFGIGSLMRLEVSNGGALTCYLNGAVILTATDTTYTSGSPGMEFTNSAAQAIDNWSGGNLHPIAQLDAEQDWTQPQHFIQSLTIGTTNPLPGALTPAGIYGPLNRLITNGPNPTCAVTGAGTGATCNPAGTATDTSGDLLIATGTTPGASGTVTLTFSSAFQNIVHCVFQPQQAVVAWNVRASMIGDAGNYSTTFFKIDWDNNAVNLTNPGTYFINYVCGGH